MLHRRGVPRQSGFGRLEPRACDFSLVLRLPAAQRYVCYKETQWEGSRNKQEQEQETMKGTRTGE